MRDFFFLNETFNCFMSQPNFFCLFCNAKYQTHIVEKSKYKRHPQIAIAFISPERNYKHVEHCMKLICLQVTVDQLKSNQKSQTKFFLGLKSSWHKKKIKRTWHHFLFWDPESCVFCFYPQTRHTDNTFLNHWANMWSPLWDSI